MGQLLGVADVRAERTRHHTVILMNRAAAPRRWLAVIGTLCVLAARSSLVHAHEIGTTRVSAVFHDRESYDIEIVTDATSLVEKLDTMAGAPMPPMSGSEQSPEIVSKRLAERDEVFRRRFTVAFDG